MKKVLFTWELGGNLGHISQLIPLAKILSTQGYQVAFTLPDLAVIPANMPEKFAVFQTPRWPHKIIGLPENAINYAEILAHGGYLSADGLTGLLRGWRSLLSLFGPDLVVAESSPTALLAARSLEIPAVVLGNGFAIPPKQAPFPPYMQVLEERSRHLVQLEDRITDNVNAILSNLGCRTLGTLADIFNVSDTCLLTFPELDHYPSCERDKYLGPIFGLENAPHMHWKGYTSYRILAYIHADSGLSEPLLHGLDSISTEMIISTPGSQNPNNVIDRYKNIQLAQQPIDIAPLLANCDLVVSHAGHGLTAQSLLAGVPLLSIPRVVEQWITARNLNALGVGEILHKDFAPEKIGALITNMLTEREYRQNAQNFAQRHTDYDKTHTIDNVVATLFRQLNIQ